MNIKDKYMTDMNRKKLSSEFKKNLADLMYEKYDSDEELVSEEIPEFDFPEKDEADIMPDIINAENKPNIKIFRYIVSAAAVLAVAVSSVLFMKNELPEHNISNDVKSTTITLPRYNEESQTEYKKKQTGEAVSLNTSAVPKTITETSAVSVQNGSDTTRTTNNDFTKKAETQKQFSVTQAPAETNSEPEKPVTTAQITEPYSETTTQPETTTEISPDVTSAPVTSETDVTSVTESEEEIILDGNKKILAGKYADIYAEVTLLDDGLVDVSYKCRSNTELCALMFYPAYNNMTVVSCTSDIGADVSDNCVLLVTVPVNTDLNGKEIAHYTFRLDKDAPDGKYEMGFTCYPDFTYANKILTNSDKQLTFEQLAIVNVNFIPDYIEINRTRSN